MIPRAAAMSAPASIPERSSEKSSKVFVVHGRDDGAKNEVALFLRAMGLEPIILHLRPNGGRHLLTKFREESEGAAFAVILMTPDDEGGIAGAVDRRPRARQNVVFELGFFIGKLGPGRVAALLNGNVEKPSDFDGIAYISFDSDSHWKTELARELHHAKVPFDPAKALTT
ncbi:MAG TPA: nucleotide-binding protein [Xanthobacteraceae bacterium]|jgi:predicted nucleotide-binding protein